MLHEGRDFCHLPQMSPDLFWFFLAGSRVSLFGKLWGAASVGFLPWLPWDPVWHGNHISSCWPHLYLSKSYWICFATSLGERNPIPLTQALADDMALKGGQQGSCSCWFIRLPRSLIFLSPARKYWFGKTRKCCIDEQIFSGIWTKHCNLWCGLIQLFSLVGPLCALLCWNTKFPWLTFFEEFHFVGHFAFPLHLLDKRKFWRVLSPMK